MVFSSLTFLLLFLPLLYLLYFARSSVRWRNGVLLVLSLLFYGWGEPVWILAMILSTAVNFCCARAITRTEKEHVRRWILALGVIASLSFLLYFKYSAFLVNTFAALLSLPFRMDPPRLPIGISFYTFQILTYTVDVYRGRAPAQKSPLRLLLYISCFPQLIAGPIVQYGDVESQLGERSVSPDDFTAGMQRFVKGLAKKVLLANVCGAALEELTLAGSGQALSWGGAWLAVFLYGQQIYFDFSAYSDMAIGLGKTLGFTYKENFDFPYASHSVTEFWRRWHISMGSFFRDYVYIPLGGSRCGRLRTGPVARRQLELCAVGTVFWAASDPRALCPARPSCASAALCLLAGELCAGHDLLGDLLLHRSARRRAAPRGALRRRRFRPLGRRGGSGCAQVHALSPRGLFPLAPGGSRPGEKAAGAAAGRAGPSAQHRAACRVAAVPGGTEL